MPRTTIAEIIGLSALSKPATRLYPFEKRTAIEGSRGHVAFKVETCVFCLKCQKECPTEAIQVDRKERAWELDRFRCIVCGACADCCPKDSIRIEPEPMAIALKRGTERTVAPSKEKPAPKTANA